MAIFEKISQKKQDSFEKLLFPQNLEKKNDIHVSDCAEHGPKKLPPRSWLKTPVFLFKKKKGTLSSEKNQIEQSMPFYRRQLGKKAKCDIIFLVSDWSYY